MMLPAVQISESLWVLITLPPQAKPSHAGYVLQLKVEGLSAFSSLMQHQFYTLTWLPHYAVMLTDWTCLLHSAGDNFGSTGWEIWWWKHII